MFDILTHTLISYILFFGFFLIHFKFGTKAAVSFSFLPMIVGVGYLYLFLDGNGTTETGMNDITVETLITISAFCFTLLLYFVSIHFDNKKESESFSQWLYSYSLLLILYSCVSFAFLLNGFFKGVDPNPAYFGFLAVAIPLLKITTSSSKN